MVLAFIVFNNMEFNIIKINCRKNTTPISLKPWQTPLPDMSSAHINLFWGAFHVRYLRETEEPPPPKNVAAPRKKPKSYQPPLLGNAYIRMLLSNTWPMSAKKMVSPCQYPRKNPGGSKPPRAGCVAHDASISATTVSRAKYNILEVFIFPHSTAATHAPPLGSIRGKVLGNAVTGNLPTTI